MERSRGIRISKFLSLVLRHRPDAAGVTLDPEGWVSVDQLLGGAARHGMRIERSELEHVVEVNDKKRFMLSLDGQRIRASQGHSLAVDLGLEPKTPPTKLYHGTVERFLADIMSTGLEKRSRQHVHLSSDETTATRVGERRGKPVVLVVAAGRMHEAGHVFYQSANGVWLTDAVPPDYLSVRGESAPGIQGGEDERH